MVEEGEQPEEVALRESEEEAGVSVQDLTHCLSVWDSPVVSSNVFICLSDE